MRVQNLEVQLDALDVEGYVLLRLPPDHVASVRLLHPIHLDLLDDDVVATHSGHDFGTLEVHFLEEPHDGIGYETVVHDLPFHDRVGKQWAHGHSRHFGLVTRVIDLHDLHEPGPDVQTDGRSLSSSKERHAVPSPGETENKFPQEC